MVTTFVREPQVANVPLSVGKLSCAKLLAKGYRRSKIDASNTGK